MSGKGGALSPAKRALLAMRDMRAELDSLRGNGVAPIAIVGMGCRFPGAPSLDAFWDLLCHKGDGIREVPEERWDWARFFHPDTKAPGKIASRWGGFLDRLEHFDAPFFGISPREAPHVDPRQRKILEIAWEALEDAGIPPFSLAGTATSVYIATLSNDYDLILSRNYSRISASTGTGTANSIIANRLSYFLDLHGPSLTLDTACSGSLLAIELACRSLRTGESSLAVAGGVSINLLPKGDVFFSAAGALSPTGHCKTFDADADGIVRSEGAGVVVLKRVAEAIEDGDRIYAVIRGGAINHDGASNGIMAPNGEAQKRVLREAYRNAGILPGQAQYVEAHGTGTPLGDPIEISALAGIMGEGRNGDPLLVGSLKTNVGHMEAAAGVASVIKTALAMHRGAIPPNSHFKQRNPRMPEAAFAMEVSSEMKAWPSNGKRRIAGVSAFSFGGTNAHLVLEEAPHIAKPADGDPANGHVNQWSFTLPISAKSPEALQALIDNYHEFLEKGADGSALNDICFTASVRRWHHNRRFAVVGLSAAVLAAQLTAASEPSRPVSKLAFVFSGQGSHWQGMGLNLYQAEPVFREVLESCDSLFADLAGWSVIAEIRSGERLHQTDISQAAVFSIQVSLAALWRSWGIEPDAVIGQSLGEVAAAYTAGALALESAVAVVYHRSRLMKTLAGQGKTAVVGLAPAAAAEAIGAWDGELYVAGNSSPATTIVSGTPSAVAALVSTLEERGIFAQAIAGVDVAFHSPHMQPLRGDLETSLAVIDCAHAKTGMMSTVTGSWLNGAKPDAGYWGRNLCEPFQLANALDKLIVEGFDGFLEISPQSLLGGPIRQVLAHQGAEAVVLGSSNRGEQGNHTLMTSLAALYMAGRDVNWAAVFPARGQCVSLPTYPWQRERYWLDQLSAEPISGEILGGHPFLGDANESALPGGQLVWERDIDLNSPHYLSGHKVLGAAVFPGAGYIETVFAAMRQTRQSAGSVLVSGVRFHEWLALSAAARTRIQLAFSQVGTGGYDFQFSAREQGSGVWIRHASGKVFETAAHCGSPVPLGDIRKSCAEMITGQEHYQAMAAQGLEYSGSFRVITKLWRARGEAIAELELDSVAAAEASDYCAHPILIDAALQVVAATIEPAEGRVYSTESYVPQAVDCARFHSSPGTRVVCVARLRSGKAGDPEVRADLLLTDAEGQVCVEIEGLRLAHVGEAGQAGARGKIRDWLYDLCWEEKAHIAAAVPPKVRSWIIFTDTAGVGQRLAGLLRERGMDCVTVTPDGGAWEEHVAESGVGVVYLHGLDDPLDPCDFPLVLVKALAANGSKEPPALWLVTRETQTAAERAPVLSRAAQLWGFAKVLAMEHPEVKSGIIDLGAPSADELEQLAMELLDPGDERQIAFEQGKRFVPRLRRSSDFPAVRSVVFRSDASYLITGGLGGLGLAVARWMIQRGARRLILVGRTPLPPRSEWRLLPTDHAAKEKVEAVCELERLGAAVHTPAFDVADAVQTAAFVEEFHDEGWPAIRGVFHAAGVVEDQLMLRLDAETFARVLRPKVDGSLALHEATKNLKLDFFTLFSSISSVLGQFGQAHYAAGNAFMDHLAHWRQGRGLPGTTINWGPWAEVGLFARLDATDKMGRSGVFPMLPDQALQAMERIQVLSPAQVVVVSADWNRLPPGPLLSGLGLAGGPIERSAEEQQAAAALLLDLLLAEPNDRRRRMEEHLRNSAASVLRLDPARIDPKEPLTSYGMDSIMVVELRNHIEETMNLNVSMLDLFTGSVAKLADQLSEKLADDGHLEELLTQVENMSPEDIEALLGGASDR
jgi:acyl transferase domain-containing protein/acyl carrier protein